MVLTRAGHLPTRKHSNHPMDFIFIRELRLEAWIGLYKYEKAAQQLIELDIEMAIPGTAVFESRKHTDTIDYSAVVKRLRLLLSYALMTFILAAVLHAYTDLFDR